MNKLVIKKPLVALLAFSLLSFNVLAENSEPSKQERINVGISDQDGTAIGLSFVPSTLDDWDLKRPGLSVTLRKKGQSDDENTEIEAYLVTLDTPPTSVSNNIEQTKQYLLKSYENNDKFKLVSFDVTQDTSIPQCVRVYYLQEHLKPTRTVAHSEKKFGESHVLSCRLLKNKNIGINVGYYHRFYEPNKDNGLADKANKIFATVKLVDERKEAAD